MNNYVNETELKYYIDKNYPDVKKKRPSQTSITSSESYDSYTSHNDTVYFNRLRGLSMISTYVFLTIKKKFTLKKRLNIRKKIRNFMERFSNDD